MMSKLSPSGKLGLRLLRRLLLIAASMVLVSISVTAGASAAPEPRPHCEKVTVPVDYPGGPGQISGTLCVPPGGAHTVQLLVHGYSYARYYWDFPYQPDKYSYVQDANRAGYATLAIDRIGDGESSHPPGIALNWNTAASTVQQVVTALRDGTVGTSFDKVILVGHSYGAVTSYLVAGRYHDVDGMIVQGIAHRVDMPDLTLRLIGQSPPAVVDEKFADSGYDPLYVTTHPTARDVFYENANADPKVIQIDERLKQTAGLLEIPTAAPYQALNPSTTTNIPVLTVNGDKDPFFCGFMAADCSSGEALANFERPFYGPDATVEGYIAEGGGHDINLEHTAPAAHQAMLDFADRHVGTS